MHLVGAAAYVLWGLLHLFAAFQVYNLGSRQAPGMVRGRMIQSAWNLACIAIFVIVVAVAYNSRNSPLGYWLNLITATVTDIGFILFVLVPGYLPLRPGLLGPALWIIAAIFSTLGALAAA